jgi:hypothetical protein
LNKIQALGCNDPGKDTLEKELLLLYQCEEAPLLDYHSEHCNCETTSVSTRFLLLCHRCRF